MHAYIEHMHTYKPIHRHIYTYTIYYTHAHTR
jgi:hypothetical protein